MLLALLRKLGFGTFTPMDDKCPQRSRMVPGLL